LGSSFSEGCYALGPEKKQAICSIPQPNTKREVREFLGVAGFCHIWIPGYSSLAKPLYEVTAGSRKDPLNWEPDQERAFQEVETVNQCTCARAAGCNTTIQSLHL
jgi:hypothetical protein